MSTKTQPATDDDSTTVALDALTPDPENRRAHNPRNIGMLVDALHRVGAARSIVIDEDGVVLAGNGVVDAAAEAGITRVRVIDADGSTLVAVRRRGLDDAQKRALALYDNRVAELAEWNPEQLQRDVDAGLSLQPWWSPEEAAKLFHATQLPGQTPQPDPTLESECVVVIRCTRDALARLTPILSTWSEMHDVTVDVS